MYKRNDLHDGRVPRNARRLIAIAAALGQEKPPEMDIHIFFRRKVTRLYKQPAFQKFLDSETAFLPKGVPGIQRWYHYINRDTSPHSCPICGKLIPDYKFKYCCHECSTKESTGAKRGPKIDLAQKEREHCARIKADLPDYRVVKFGYPRSLHRHSCGLEFEANNYALYRGSVKCECLHKKVVVQTLANLKRQYRRRKSIWIPVEYAEGETATFKNKKCEHLAVLPWDRQFDLRCPICYPNKFGTRVKTHDQYVKWLSRERPEFKLVGHYVDSRTVTKYRHLTCGSTFYLTPGGIPRFSGRCPECAPKTAGTSFRAERDGEKFKLRGKELVALDWILKETRVHAYEIAYDLEGTVPVIKYTLYGIPRKYKPDFYIARLNMLLEVKGMGTIGLLPYFDASPEELWEMNCTKARAALQEGYRFKMLLFTPRNVRLKLPSKWYSMSHKDIMRWYNKQKESKCATC